MSVTDSTSEVDLTGPAFAALVTAGQGWAEQRLRAAGPGAESVVFRDVLTAFYCVTENARIGGERFTGIPELVNATLQLLVQQGMDSAVVGSTGVVSPASFLYVFLSQLHDWRESYVEEVHAAGRRFIDAWDTFLVLKDPLSLLQISKSASSEHGPAQNEFNLPPIQQPSDAPLEQLLDELQDLIGLSEVKQQILAAVDGQLANAERRRRGLPDLKPNLHLVFAGNPGTGKTTVARLVGEIYHRAGILSKGHLLEIGPGHLLGRWQGENTQRAQAAIDAAAGGVLLIDEAYTLAGTDRGPMEFQQQVIDTLVKGIEDHRSDLVVILTGYTAPMRTFISSNPGLESRIGEWVEFPDYSTEELMDILGGLLEHYRMSLPEASRASIEVAVGSLERNERFGNARLVRNVFEDLVTVLNVRLRGEDLQQLPDEVLNGISESDADSVINEIASGKANRKRSFRIGFGI